MKSLKVRNILSLICSAIIFVSTLGSVISFFTVGGRGNMEVVGTRCFRYFTIDSNILAAIACAITAGFSVRSLKRGKDAVPAWALTLKFVGTVAVGVTFFTVAFFLGPILGYGAMVAGANLLLHLTSPVLAMLAYIMFDSGDRLRFPHALTGLIPTVIYGALYFVMVVVLGENNGGWQDFYSFNVGGRWYVSVAAMLLATLAIASALWALGRAAAKKRG